ncbi:transcriptional regulator domain-containing protein [Paremcibacter congregatus]|uniref:Transcriptional regulator-like domain-containing protein n=1 Tax=Paremcibacter congregatus TaxID=2043170 RepID=A0A2G4YWP0_9PROT|nr:hypothetical protein [Paremcibacter congregatus]PHZ86729.1 hypothetical protein CRD36_00305 [Paremcibacter congregatus]QDE27623.1 hypothetical protein FIV45_10200 [Paremcibacter congregatus]
MTYVKPQSKLYLPSLPNALSSYDYVASLSGSALAWEYLRRHPDYCRDWRISRAGRLKPLRLTSGTKLIRIRRQFLRALKWGLYFFR